MDTMDFHKLTDFDFERLCRDLFEEVLGVRLELFAPGADGGVDLRYMSGRRKEVVIQCKHWMKSGRAKLVRHMLNQELAKVKKLKPERYILATTVNMTRGAKDKLYEAFQPFIKSPSDIFGIDEISALLQDNSMVIRKHIRLWLNDPTVLEAMISKNIVWRSLHFAEEIEEALRTYVPTTAYHKTIKLLDSRNICIISGAPGVGKTTLAQVVSAHYAAEGYELVEVSENIEDVNRMWNPTSKQIFVYDDFLGQSTLEDKLYKNEDGRLLSLMKIIAKGSTKKLICTTRSYILAQGKERYERLDRARIQPITYVVDLSEFRRETRASILYNHTYWSGWPDAEKARLARPENYRKIIDHQNFNPRVVADALAAPFDPSLGDSVSQLEASLGDPMRVWRHIFDNQLSENDRTVLSALFSLGGEAYADRLQEALLRHGDDWNISQIKSSIKILDGTFVKVLQESGRQLIEFSNPSVNDFMIRKMSDDRQLIVRILSKAFSFDQVANIWIYHSDSPGAVNGNYKIDLRSLSGTIERAVLKTLELPESSTRGLVGRLAIAMQISNDLDLPQLTARIAEILSVRGRVYGGQYDDIAELLLETARSRDYEIRRLHESVLLEGLTALFNRDRSESGVFTAAIYAHRLSTLIEPEVLTQINTQAIEEADRLMGLYQYWGSDDLEIDIDALIRALQYISLFEDYYVRWPMAEDAMEEFRINVPGENEEEVDEIDDEPEWVDGVVYEIMSSLVDKED
ncbi:nSTAND3 domain-containing NTPase [Actinomadura geliboluensis]